jgi:hypothetical protein
MKTNVTEFTRRQFLKLAGYAAAASALNGVPAVARSAASATTAPARIGANLDVRYPTLNSYSPPGGINPWQYMVDRCVAAGINTARVDLTRWSWVELKPETKPGVMYETHPSIAASDTILPMLKSAGIRVYTMLRQGLPAAFSSPWPTNQLERDRFWDYCQWFLDRWGSYLYAVELLNEPDQAPDGRTDTYVQYYGDFVRDIGARIKEFYPKIKIVACNNNDWANFTDRQGWVRRVFTYAFPNPEEWKMYFDEVGIHYYFTGEKDFSRTRMKTWITYLHDYLSANFNNGESIPLSLTETGCSLRPSSAGVPGYPITTVEEQQLWMRNTFEAIRDMPFLKSVLFYELFENTSVEPTNREANYCYIKRDYTELATMATFEQEIAAYYSEFPAICDADFNNNNIVDSADLSRLKAKLGTSSEREDLNGNGLVDPADMSILKSCLGKMPGWSGTEL